MACYAGDVQLMFAAHNKQVLGTKGPPLVQLGHLTPCARCPKGPQRDVRVAAREPGWKEDPLQARPQQLAHVCVPHTVAPRTYQARGWPRMRCLRRGAASLTTGASRSSRTASSSTFCTRCALRSCKSPSLDSPLKTVGALVASGASVVAIWLLPGSRSKVCSRCRDSCACPPSAKAQPCCAQDEKSGESLVQNVLAAALTLLLLAAAANVLWKVAAVSWALVSAAVRYTVVAVLLLVIALFLGA